MGMEFEITTLEEMCALMCDNKIPRKGGKIMDKERKCGQCKFHQYYDGWFCMNDLSFNYACETDFNDECEDFEERKEQ